MKVQALLLLLVLLPAVGAQNETDGTNETETADPEETAGGFDLGLAISLAAVAFLVVAFVFVAKR